MVGKYIYSSDNIKNSIVQIMVNDSLKNDKLNTKDNKSKTIQIILTKALSSSNDVDPTFDNIAEILQYTNTVGRRSEIPGDYSRNPKVLPQNSGEGDTDWTETISITPPTGENRAHYFVITGIVLTILAGGVFVIKKKVLDK